MPRTTLCLLLLLQTACSTLAFEVCDSGVDDDFNGFIDCEDPVCSRDVACRPPLFVTPDTFDAQEDTTLVLPREALLANDSGAQALFVIDASLAEHGTLSLSETSISFTPDPDFFGTAHFSYLASDGFASASALVTLQVAPTNDAPIANDDNLSTAQNTPTTVNTESLLSNDTDIDSPTLSVVSVDSALNGSASLTGNAITFSPNTNFVGAASFRYTLSDGDSTDEAIVTVSVQTPSPSCGDGTLNPNEQCDDGNTTNGDGCSGTCTIETPPSCGDGTVQGSEQCDDANQSNNDTCTNACQNARCGDGFLHTGTETCDDGNLLNNDGCSASCSVENNPVCGNGTLEGNDQCDDGNLLNNDGCSASCSVENNPVCGNGTLEGNEQCDDGNTTNGDGCDSNCTPSGCGNGVASLGEFCTLAKPNVSGGTSPSAIDMGDVNQDGIFDLVIANFSSDNLSIRLGVGDGTFTNASNVAAGDGPSGIALLDANDDGVLDAVVTLRNEDKLAVLLGNGVGGFAAPTKITVQDQPTAITKGELTGDTRVDVAILYAGTNSSIVSPMRNLGNGSFAFLQGMLAQQAPNDIELADLNGDNHLDMAVSNASSNTLSLFFGDGTGLFPNSTTINTAASQPLGIAVGDFQGDGNADLAVMNSFGKKLGIHLGNGLGSFANPVFTTLSNTPQPLLARDFDHDGKSDLLTSFPSSNLLGVFFASSNGQFLSPQLLSTATGPTAVASADLDGNGFDDFVSVNSTTISVVLFVP